MEKKKKPSIEHKPNFIVRETLKFGEDIDSE